MSDPAALSDPVGHDADETDAAIEATVREILARHGRLAVDALRIGLDDDLFDGGMTSHASVEVMLGLEDHFDFEFPDSLLNKRTFQTVRSLCAAIKESAVDAAG